MSTIEQLPAVRITRRERALIDLGAEALAEIIAPLFPAPSPDPEPEPEQVLERRAPYQQLVSLPQGAGTTGSVHVVASDPMWPLSVMCRLTTSAAAADRTVAVEYQDGNGVRFLVAGSQAVVQANGQQSFCWFGSAGAVAWPIEDAAISPLPEQYLSWGQRLALHVWNGDAGDVLDQCIVSARFEPV